MKKSVSLLIAAAVACMSVTTGFADVADENVTTFVTESGISAYRTVRETDIENLPESVKYELENTDGTLVSISTTYFDLETGAQTRAVMPESDFQISLDTFYSSIFYFPFLFI